MTCFVMKLWFYFLEICYYGISITDFLLFQFVFNTASVFLKLYENNGNYDRRCLRPF